MTIKQANEYITHEVLRALEKGVIPWHQPWKCAENATPDPRIMPVSFATGKCYSLANQWLIMLSGHGAGEYATFAQVKAQGGTVKKGEHGVGVFFYKTLAPIPLRDKEGKIQIDDLGRVIQFTPWIARLYKVFNVYTQCEGVSPKWKERAENAERELAKREGVEVSPIDSADAVVAGYTEREGVVIRHGGERAFYSPFDDSITLPARELFDSMPYYYKTLFHEIAHSTGNAKRLKRKMGGLFGNYDYGREELVAEMTAAMIMQYLALPVNLPDSAAYIKSWMKACKEDEGAIMYASRQALKACSFITGETAAAEDEGDGDTDKAA